MILPLLGQALPDPTHFASLGWTLASLAALVIIVRNAIGLWRDVSRPSGSDAMAQASAQYQLRGDYVTRQEVDQKLAELSAEIEGVGNAVFDCERRMGESSEERIKGVHARLDLMPDRIIAQLSNLGVLRKPGASEYHGPG
jgi:hypothetical protein